MRDKDLKRLEDDLLVLCLDNYSINLFGDDRQYTDDRRPNSEINKPGKTSTWYAYRLKVGSRTFMRIVKQACAKQFLEERKVWRYRSYAGIRLELTPLGKEIAARLKSERTGDLPESPEDQLIKVCIQVDSPLIQEEPLLVFNKENCLTALAAVTLLREKSDSKEYIITRSDITIVTLKREDNGKKILVKGVEICYPLYKRIKRMVRLTLSDKNLQFAFVPHKLLPRTYLSTTKSLRSVQAKQMLQEWNCFKKSPFS